MQQKQKSFIATVLKRAAVITGILAFIEVIVIFVFMGGDKKENKKPVVTTKTVEVAKPIITEGIKDTTKIITQLPIAKAEPAKPEVPKQEAMVAAPKQEPAKAETPTSQPSAKQELPKQKPVADSVKKPAIVAKAAATKKDIVKAPETKPANQPAVVKELSEEEMTNILNKINAEKTRLNNKTNCIQIRKTNTGVENGLKIANFLKAHGFVISGREVIQSTVKGVHIDASSACIKLTIGNL